MFKLVRSRGGSRIRLAAIMLALPAALVPMGFVAQTSTVTAASNTVDTTPVEETPVDSLAPDASTVLESYVSLYAPLPTSDGTVPPACERIGYLRFRNAAGPTDSADADAIYVAQPGIFEGAGALDQVARNVVTAAAAKGYNVEFWALSRRSNCLEDLTGITAAIAAKNPEVAMGYYYQGQSVDGQTFPGFVSEANASWLSHVGLAQTVEDEYTVISQLPPSVRETKVFCGGHSLGGIITAAFANWDFSGDGNPADAGYNQCAGYFALDTRLNTGAASEELTASTGDSLSSILSLASSSSPYLSAGPFSPEVFASLPILGMASYFDPNQLVNALLDQFPNDSSFKSTFNLLFSASLKDFVADSPKITQFRATDQAAIGITFGDVSQPIGILRASIGVPAGGPVVEKTFPVAYGSPAILSGLLGGQDQVAPDPVEANPNGSIYRWLNYNQVPTPGPSPINDPGEPYTSASSEVSDITQLSRNLFDAPALFTEDYFPTQLVLDLGEVAAGDLTGSLSDLKYTDGITEHPAAYIDAGQGITPDMTGASGAIPDGPAPQVHVVAPGYNHLDVVTSAYDQTNGQPEIVSSTLTNWVAQIIGPPSS
jgi:hypothetical protein